MGGGSPGCELGVAAPALAGWALGKQRGAGAGSGGEGGGQLDAAALPHQCAVWGPRHPSGKGAFFTLHPENRDWAEGYLTLSP